MFWSLHETYFFLLDQVDLESVRIEEFYGIDATPNLKRNFWGSWSNATGLDVTEEYQWERRKDLTGVTIKSTTTNVSFIIALSIHFC